MSEYLEETLQEIYKEEFKIKVEYFDTLKYKILVKKNKSKKAYVYLYYYDNKSTLDYNVEKIKKYINKVIGGFENEHKSFGFIRT